MTEARKTHHHGALKEALVALALEAAREGTVEEMSLREASRRLGVSPGAVYRHYPDKEALMRALALRGFDMLAEGFEAAVPYGTRSAGPEDAVARFVTLAEAYVAFSVAHYGLWRLMFGPHGAGLVPEGRPSAFGWLAKALEELHAEGVIASPDAEDARFAWAAIHGLSDLRASPAVSIPRKGVGETCARILRGLGAGAVEFPATSRH
jgi:AcrR family transcriptional regulator